MTSRTGQDSVVDSLKNLFSALQKPLTSVQKFDYQPIHTAIADAKQQAANPATTQQAPQTVATPATSLEQAATAIQQKATNMVMKSTEAGMHRVGDRMEKAGDMVSRIIASTINEVANQIEKGNFPAMATAMADGLDKAGSTMNAGMKVAGHDVRKGMEKAATKLEKHDPIASKELNAMAKKTEVGFQESGQQFEMTMNEAAEKNREWGQAISTHLENPEKLATDDAAWDDFESWLSEAGESVNKSSEAIAKGYEQTGQKLSSTFNEVGQHMQETAKTAYYKGAPDIGRPALLTLGTGLVKAGIKVIPVFADAAKSAIQGLASVGGKIKDGVENIGQKIKQGFTAFGDQISSGMNKVKDGVNSATSAVGNAFTSFGNNIKDGFVGGFNKVGNFFKESNKKIADTFNKVGVGIQTAAVNTGNFVKNGVNKAIDTVIKKPMQKVKNFFKSLF
ncbi:hypothetical protein [Parendozoicomonas haliclonae]